MSLRHDHRSETISFRRSSIASSEKKRIYRARPTHHDDRLTRPHPVFPRGRVPRGEGNALGASFTDDTVWPPPAKVRFRKPTFFGPRFAPVPAQPTIAFFFTKKKNVSIKASPHLFPSVQSRIRSPPRPRRQRTCPTRRLRPSGATAAKTFLSKGRLRAEVGVSAVSAQGVTKKCSRLRPCCRRAR